MSRVYLNSFEPLCLSRQGRDAAAAFDLPPFIDGSCRREPDLEAKHPTVPALCRGGVFVPKLRPGDVIVYLTKKARYEDLPPHWRLVAVVEVKEKFESHEVAAEWYRSQGEPLPANCMVEGNSPVAWEQTHQQPALPDGEERNLSNWDRKYQEHAAKHPQFCVCDARFRELRRPPMLLEDDMRAIFSEYGRIPVTQNPPVIGEADFARVMAFVK